MSIFANKEGNCINVTEECLGYYTEIDEIGELILDHEEYSYLDGLLKDELFEIEELEELEEDDDLEEIEEALQVSVEKLDAVNGPAACIEIEDSNLYFRDRGGIITFSNEENNGISLVKSLIKGEWSLDQEFALGEKAWYCSKFRDYSTGEHYFSMGWREHPDEEISMKKALHEILRAYGLENQSYVLHMVESGLEITQIWKIFEEQEFHQIRDLVSYHRKGLIKSLTPSKRELKKAFLRSEYGNENIKKTFKKDLEIPVFKKKGYELTVAKNLEDLIDRSLSENICVGQSNQRYFKNCKRGFAKILFLDNKQTGRRLTIEFDCLKKRVIQVSGFANDDNFSDEEFKIIDELEETLDSLYEIVDIETQEGVVKVPDYFDKYQREEVIRERLERKFF